MNLEKYWQKAVEELGGVEYQTQEFKQKTFKKATELYKRDRNKLIMWIAIIFGYLLSIIGIFV